MHLVIVVFSLSLVFATAKEDHFPKMAKGHNAPPGSHPWLMTMYKVERISGDKNYCGANLIAVPDLVNESDIALTAAHCFNHPCRDSFSKYKFIVIAGNHSQRVLFDLEKGEEIVDVIDADCPHKGDIAVIKLARPLKFSNTIKPIPIPADEDTDTVPVGINCTVAGWGNMNYSIQSKKLKYWNRPSVLQEVDVQIATHKECISNSDTIDGTNICQIIRDSGHPLRGDSGGALVCPSNKTNQQTMFGLVSRGTVAPTGDRFGTAVFTKVSHFVTWIKKTITSMRKRDMVML